MRIEQLIKEEKKARVKFNKLLQERKRIDSQIRLALDELNSWKRHAYALGFTGNVMRDKNGDRI